MRNHTSLATTFGLSLALAFSGAAFAADGGSGANGASGASSGPAAGGNVQPGTDNGASSQGNQKATGAAGGGPGVQGPKGSKNGPADQPPSK
jgi:hypothetical protein